MTDPRRVIAGSTQFVTRKTSLDRFFLVPRKEVLELLWYCAAVAAWLYRIELHAFVVMGNHCHWVLTDHEGNLPEYMRWFGHNTACALNRLHGGTGKDTIWDPVCSYTNVQLHDAAVVEQKVLYTLMNPVSAGLVPRAGDWELGVSLPHQFGRKQRLRRPGFYFRKKGSRLPEVVDLVLTRPALLAELYPNDRAYREGIQKQLARAEREVQREFKRGGRTFMGLARARSRDPQDRPRRKRGEVERTRLRWPFQCSDPDFRDHLERDHLIWLSDARKTFPVWKEKKTRPKAVFPHGSYKWVRVFGANVAPPPAPDP